MTDKKTKRPFARFLLALILGPLIGGMLMSGYCVWDNSNGWMQRFKGRENDSNASIAVEGFVMGMFPGVVAGLVVGILFLPIKSSPDENQQRTT